MLADRAREGLTRAWDLTEIAQGRKVIEEAGGAQAYDRRVRQEIRDAVADG